MQDFIMQRIIEYLPPNEVDMVIYHKSCSDGFCSAFCMYWYRKQNSCTNEIVYLPKSYLDEVPDVTGKNVLVVDFSYKKEQSLHLMKQANRFVVLDHHKSAMNELEGLEELGNCRILFDMNRSGAMLAWDYCFPDVPAPLLVKLVQDRDLWKWELEGSKNFSAVFLDVPFIFEEYERYLNESEIKDAMMKGKIVGEYVDRCVKVDASRAVERTFLGYNVKCLNCTRNMSEVGNEIVNDSNVDFAVLWRYDQNKHKYVFSLRANGKVDTTLISSKFGGGGHPNASGFSLDSLPDELV